MVFGISTTVVRLSSTSNQIVSIFSGIKTSLAPDLRFDRLQQV